MHGSPACSKNLLGNAGMPETMRQIMEQNLRSNRQICKLHTFSQNRFRCPGGGMAPSPAMTGAFPAMPTGGGAPGGGGGYLAASEKPKP